MTPESLIQAIVRQTAVLIAQVATADGMRTPLARVEDQVFLGLVEELERQGVSRRLSSDLFGLGLRTYQRKIQRLTRRPAEPSRWLKEAVLAHIRARGPLRRSRILSRFSTKAAPLVRAAVHELCESGVVIRDSDERGPSYRAASEEELGARERERARDGSDDGRRILDEYEAIVATLLGRVERERVRLGHRVADNVCVIDTWEGHPLADEIGAALERVRAALSDLRERVQRVGPGDGSRERSQVVAYFGECPLDDEAAGERFERALPAAPVT